MTISVLLADDHVLVRSGIRMILDAQDDITVVGEAADGAEVVAAGNRLRPDVVLMDIRMPGADGIEATRRLCAGPRPPRVVMLTTFDHDDYVYEALAAGAVGFLLKSAPPVELVHGVRAAAAGDATLAPSVTRRLVERLRGTGAPSRHDEALATLTPREREVLVHVARGASNGEIARSLVLSDATVKSHVNRILAKLHARDRVRAVVIAYEAGLVRPGD